MENLSYASTSVETRKGIAVASLVIGLVSIFTFGLLLVGAIAGLALGLVALRRTQRRPEQYGGMGYAVAGITTSAVGILCALLLLIAISVYFARPIRVEGQAMMPALHDGQRIIANRMVGEIKRGDIVVFWAPYDPSRSYIKRVVGLPDEEINIEDGKLFINGERIEEPYLNADYLSHDSLPAPVRVSEHHYFVLGDNRRNSSDSRYWGLVPEKYIYAKVER